MDKSEYLRLLKNITFFNITVFFKTVSKCPAARQGLKWTKCLAVRNFHNIFLERLFQAFQDYQMFV